MNIVSIVEVKILQVTKWSYESLQLRWLFYLEWIIVFWAHSPILFNTCFLVFVLRFHTHHSQLKFKCTKIGTSTLSVLIMVHIVGYTTDLTFNTKTLSIVLWVHTIYQPTIINIKVHVMHLKFLLDINLYFNCAFISLLPTKGKVLSISPGHDKFN
jgi:hypothetical protein